MRRNFLGKPAQEIGFPISDVRFMRAEFLPFIVFLLAVAACGGDKTTTDLTPPDTTAPSVTLTEPGPVTLSGSVTLSASATDDQGVAKVRFRVDEQDAAPEITSPPYVVV